MQNEHHTHRYATRDAGTYADRPASERPAMPDANRSTRRHVETVPTRTPADPITEALRVECVEFDHDDVVETLEWCQDQRMWAPVAHGTAYEIGESIAQYLSGIYLHFSAIHEHRLADDMLRGSVRTLAYHVTNAKRGADEAIDKLAKFKDSAGGKSATFAITNAQDRLDAKSTEIDLAAHRLRVAVEWCRFNDLDLKLTNDADAEREATNQQLQEAARTRYRDRLAKIKAQQAQRLVKREHAPA